MAPGGGKGYPCHVKRNRKGDSSGWSWFSDEIELGWETCLSTLAAPKASAEESMSKTTTELPFTELVERVIEITRAEAENGQSRARGAINDAYCREIPSKEDWSFLLASSSLTTQPRYATGTVTVNTQQTNCVFSTDASVPTALSPARIKFSGNDNVYEFARTNAT